MPRIATVAVCNDRFASLDSDSLSDSEKASLVQLALSVLAERYSRGHALGACAVGIRESENSLSPRPWLID